MVSHMKEVSKMGNKAGVDTDIPTAMSMKVNGKMISKKVKGLCGILISTSMKVTGSKAKRMDGESISTIMVQSMKEISPMEGNKALEQLLFLMVQKYKPTGSKLMLREKEKYFIPMVTFSKVNIKCHKSMVKECISGVPTTLNIKVNLRKIP